MSAVVPVRLRRCAPTPKPTSELLIDGFGRINTGQRVSLTDRCNLRCVYCMPANGVECEPRAEILTYEMIARVLGLLASWACARCA